MRLFTKLILLIAILVIGIGHFSAIHAYRMMRQELEDELTNRSLILGNILSKEITSKVLLGETLPTREALVNLVRSRDQVIYAFVTDFDGVIMAFSFDDGFPRGLLEDNIQHKDGHNHWHHYRVNRMDIKEIATPLAEGLLAFLHIGFNESSIEAKAKTLRNRILLLTLVVAGIGLLFGAIVSHRITHPLRRLASSMESFGSGDMPVIPDPSGSGFEVTELTTAFEEMLHQRLAAQEALVQSETQKQAILDGSTDLIMLLDRNMELIWANKRALELNPHAIGMACHEAFWSNRDICNGCPALKAFNSGKVEKSTTFHRSTETRAETYMDDIAVPLKDKDGQVQYILSTSRDITDERRAEEERRSLEAQMQHAQKLESLGVLAGGIAHDFNNLLVGVLGNADIALKKIKPESPAWESITFIREAGNQAADLARHMLTYSGKGTHMEELYPLNNLITEMAPLLGSSIGKRVSIEYDLEDQLPALRIDLAQIRQIVMNLITNGSDAIGDKAGTIIIRTQAINADRVYLSNFPMTDQLTEGDYQILTVSDTGCGMDEEAISKLFDPFFTTKFTGRGLGMAAVHGIIQGHKGAIHITSQPGEGSTFMVLLPQDKEERLPSDSTPTDIKTDDSWSPSGTVLIIDDEKWVRMVAKEMLEETGFQVMTAETGEEGLALFRRAPAAISAVIMDLTMKDMDGNELLRELRRNLERVKVVLTTGYSESKVDIPADERKNTQFLPKPFSSQDLVGALQILLTNH